MATQPQNPTTAQTSALQVDDDRELRVACFCEENVWRLAYRKTTNRRHQTNNNNSLTETYFVVFISNPRKCVPMFHQVAAQQRSSEEEGDSSRDEEEESSSSSKNPPVFWDYHVILLAESSSSSSSSSLDHHTVIYDMDSDLPYPCPIKDYLGRSFAGVEHFRDEFKPMFRVVQASQFLNHFSSDRMHMWDEATGRWSADPPTYQCIQPKGESSNNLMQYMDMTTTNNSDGKNQEDGCFGKVYSISQLLAKFR